MYLSAYYPISVLIEQIFCENPYFFSVFFSVFFFFKMNRSPSSLPYFALLSTSLLTHQLVSPCSTLGRDPSCSIVLSSPSVSRTHCVVSFDPVTGLATLRDLGTRNGTWVNGGRLGTEGRVLEEGDTVRIGYDKEVYIFKYRIMPQGETGKKGIEQVGRGERKNENSLWTAELRQKTRPATAIPMKSKGLDAKEIIDSRRPKKDLASKLKLNLNRLSLDSKQINANDHEISLTDEDDVILGKEASQKLVFNLLISKFVAEIN